MGNNEKKKRRAKKKKKKEKVTVGMAWHVCSLGCFVLPLDGNDSEWESWRMACMERLGLERNADQK